VEAVADGGDRGRGVTAHVVRDHNRVRVRFQRGQLAVLVMLICGAAAGVVLWRRASQPFNALGLLAALPVDRATLLYIDADALRHSGILDLLAGSKAAEEPDYRKFVEQTGFDYRTDVDAVAAAFVDGDTYLTVRGRFQWKLLFSYARSQGGECGDTFCTMPASAQNHRISFYPLHTNVLALAVSAQPSGAHMIGANQWKNPPALPPEPVWISAPAPVFSKPDLFPAGTRAFLSPLAGTRSVTFAMGPQGDRLQLRLEVACASPQAAAEMVQQFSSATGLLKKMIERDHLTPNPRDLSGVLVAGSFQQQDARVIGTWPVERGFIAAVASGRIQ
jgi:hypothetical protein